LVFPVNKAEMGDFVLRVVESDFPVHEVLEEDLDIGGGDSGVLESDLELSLHWLELGLGGSEVSGGGLERQGQIFVDGLKGLELGVVRVS
jgi:hypothetical protein